jgi:single-stranded-DNA-specific exonuclease
LSEALKAYARLEKVFALYGKSGRTTAESARIPDRNQFARLYQTLRRIAPIASTGHADRLAVMLGYAAAMITFMLEVFEELGFIVMEEGELRLVESPVKKDLSHSARYRDAARRQESERILFAPTKEFAEWVRREARPSTMQINEGVGVS